MLTPEAKKRMLEAFLPAEPPVYFALLIDPTSAKEISDPNYQRVLVDAWETVPDGTTRLNLETIEWPAVQGPVVVRGVGLFDAPTGGKLLALMPTRTLLGGIETELNLAPGDVPRLPVGAVRIQVK
jgi:hypothetical protein